jgi:toxin FitB
VIVLDTNVLSEALKPAPSQAVLRWLGAQASLEVFTTTITVAEVCYGIEAMPPGKRRTQLLAAVEKMLAEQFDQRVLPFDEEAAQLFGRIVAGREAAGRPISQFDAMIAAIARLHHATVATRNIDDFEHCAIKLINPWQE